MRKVQLYAALVCVPFPGVGRARARDNVREYLLGGQFPPRCHRQNPYPCARPEGEGLCRDSGDAEERSYSMGATSSKAVSKGVSSSTSPFLTTARVSE